MLVVSPATASHPTLNLILPELSGANIRRFATGVRVAMLATVVVAHLLLLELLVPFNALTRMFAFALSAKIPSAQFSVAVILYEVVSPSFTVALPFQVSPSRHEPVHH